MRTARLDGCSMENKEIAHRYIQEVLNIPSYYGYNLDALYDALSLYDKELSIMLFNKPDIMD
ncbi:barstar family protein [Alkalibacterium sp. 20]|uniref:barstar family protein n=1 Tax=Alkalibacterium sp. 20 TaxID=1798803 RepID=UPI00090025D4|nr:barstar family protein [Alkalibacterium sp. 20]